ncbi:hypothetical protein [Streptomyces sp. NPDC006668]|uniref:hypothetical protein n=1 Tax=Streptomyces sp. NPDC006668 TaxID=3156903 RepID=UPI0033E23A5A
MGLVIFFQLVGAVLQFEVGQLATSRLGLAGLAGALMLALTPVLIRKLVQGLRRSIDTSPEWWAAGLLLALIALCLYA